MLLFALKRANEFVALSDEEGVKTFFDEEGWREGKAFYQKEVERIERDLKEGNYIPPGRRSRAA